MRKWSFLLVIGAVAMGGAFLAGMKVGSSSASTVMTGSANAAQPSKPAAVLPAETPAPQQAPPSAPADETLLAKYYGEVIRCGPNSAKRVALTFDDGPSQNYNAQFIELLQKEKVPATFFVIGRNVTSYPSLLKNTSDAGFEIGLHTMNHPDPTRATTERMQAEIQDELELVQGITGKKPYLFRPPGGKVTAAEREITRDNGLVIVNWSVDPQDWRGKDANAIHSIVMRDLHPGAIVCMHEIKPNTLEVLPRLIADIRAQGYEFVTVGQLIQDAAVAPPEALGTTASAAPTPIAPQAIPMNELKGIMAKPAAKAIP